MQYEAKLFNVVAGVIFGAAPFIVGMFRNRMELAFAALILCAVLGRMGGLYLSVPGSLITLVAIFLAKKG
jgi:hypothetical protein